MKDRVEKLHHWPIWDSYGCLDLSKGHLCVPTPLSISDITKCTLLSLVTIKSIQQILNKLSETLLLLITLIWLQEKLNSYLQFAFSNLPNYFQ